MLIAVLVALLATPFPSSSKTSWMTPLAFHLTIGMKKDKALKTLSEGGWKTHAGKAPNQILVDYTDTRSVTVELANDRIRSIRFELYGFFPEVKEAFDEIAGTLEKQEGPARRTKSGTILIFDQRLPNIFVVMSLDRNSPSGKQGVGFLTVRYFEPSGEE